MVLSSPLPKTHTNVDGAPLSRWGLVTVRSKELQKQLKLERASHTATVVNGAIYVIAGRKGTTFYGDLLRLDTTSNSWSVVCRAISNNFRPRANHTATLVGGRHIWVISGSDNDQVLGDVHVLDVQTYAWTKPQIRGETSLLSRTAHSAEVHPCDPRAIILFGGYDGAAFHNDLVVLHTDTLTVERLAISTGVVPAPVPRSYHSCTAVGSRCYVYGGRTESGLVDTSEMLAVFDAAANRWLAPQVEGSWPQARSSHRAVALGDRLLIHGGAAASEQTERLSDVHSLMICPDSERLTWSRLDEPPRTSGSTPYTWPQGRAAHTINLVGRDCLYVMFGYMGAHSGPQRYSADVFQLMLGVPVCEPSPNLPRQPSTSPRHSTTPTQYPTQQHTPKARRSSPRSGATAAHVEGAGHPSVELPAVTAAAHNAPSTPQRTSSLLPHDTAADTPRPSKRRLAASGAAQATSAAAAAQSCKPRLQTAAQKPNGSNAVGAGAGQPPTARAVSSGAGVEDDPIDLTAEQAPAAVAPMARRALPPPRYRVGVDAGESEAPEVSWLAANRRGRGGVVSNYNQQAEVAGAGAGPARAHASAGHGRPLTAAQAEVSDAADGRMAKRQASDAAVAAAVAAEAPAPPQRGRLPVHVQPSGRDGAAGVTIPAAVARVATAAAAAQQHLHPAMGPGLLQAPSPATDVAWQVQAEMYDLAPGTIAAAATTAANAALAATAAAGGGAAQMTYPRPASPPHSAGLAKSSQEALLTQLLQDNQSLRRQLQEAKEAERLADQNLAEQQRRTAEALSTQRRSCEMTQVALRTVNTELEEARSRLEHLQQERAACRQQAAAQQQQAAVQQADVERERARLHERIVILQQQQSEESRKHQEQVKSLETLCDRYQEEAGKAQQDLRAQAARYGEQIAALNERLVKREQDAVELTNQLREVAAQNQKLQQEMGRLQDMKQRLERDIGEAREAQQRMQRQMDEQLGEMSRQRDSLQIQLTHANTRLAALDLDLRRAKDNLAHRDAQHAALLQANAEKAAELTAVRDQLRAVQQKQEVTRQQAGILSTQLQTLHASLQAMASAS